jgi:microcystin-dependent protein
MEGTVGEIRLFGGTFAPANWLLCQGQTLPISNNEPLYTIIGTMYGGDGVSTFNLPDMRSKVVIGAGQSIGLSNYIIGQTGGSENVTLTAVTIPTHTHAATVQANLTVASAALTLNGAAGGAGGGSSAAGSLLGTDTNAGIYSSNRSANLAKMSLQSVQFNQSTLNTIPVPSGVSGGSSPHTNIQPYSAVNYIICCVGIFPSRD